MRRRIYTLSLLVVVLCITSCGKHYYIENDLHGMWQVASVENILTDEVFDAKGELYYMFQRSMVFLYYNPQNTNSVNERYISQISIVGEDSIGMGDFRVYTTGEGDFVNQEVKVSLDRLRKFGLFNDYTTFYMEQSKQKLILTSDSAQIVLRRY